MKKKEIFFIVGPTAVGKTNVAFRLAKEVGGEIVSCDAMQVYKNINIASNKPSKGMIKEIPHHVVDIISPEEDFSVAIFNQLAKKAIEEIFSRGKIPIVVGGSGMYMQILLDGIFEGGDSDPEVKKQLEDRLQEEGNEVLYEELKKVDPKSAEKIHLNDSYRIIRALEVYLNTNKPMSEIQKLRSGIWGEHDILIYALNRDRESLYGSINERVEQMIKEGLVEEIGSLKKIDLSATARKIIGVEEIMGYINGEYDIKQAEYLIKLNTRHYAKRQLTWFRKDKRLHWIEINEDETAQDVVERILQDIKSRR